MKIRVLILMLFLTLPSVLFAASQEEPTIYVIKQGDTLWGLSERFIKDPNYWPNMWSKNSQITNPHFIYPGQQVRIFPDRLEFVPKEQPVVQAQKNAASPSVAEKLQEVAAEKTYTVYGSEGFLAEEDFKPDGFIVGAQHNRIMVALDDIVYTDIGGEMQASSGDKYSIFAKDIPVKHPITKEKIGDKIIPLGTLQLTDVEQKSSRAIITKAVNEIGPGSYLLRDKNKDNHKKEVTLKQNDKDLKGYIVESRTGISVIAAGDVVYIDLGSNLGVEAGNMLYIVRDVTIDKKFVSERIDKLPQELLGALVVLETRGNTSTALVVKSIETIYKGDRIVTQTK